MRLGTDRLFAGVAMGVGLWMAGTALAPAVLFDHRENVNILNSYTVSISSNFPSVGSPALPPSVLRANSGDNDPWQVDFAAAPPNPYLSFDFSSVRNVSKMNYMAYSSAALAIGGADIQVSGDGITWGPVLPSTWTHLGAPTSQFDRIDLSTPVDTRYLRMTITSLGPNHRTGDKIATVAGLKMYGAAGTLTASDIDLVSSTGLANGDANLATPPVQMTMNGGALNVTGTADFINDAILERTMIYNMAAGSGFTLTFDQAFTFTKFAYRVETTSGHYKVEVGDGTTWNEAANWTGGNELQFINLASFSGTQLRFTNIDGTGDTIREVMAFGTVVPEPASLALLALGGLGLLRRRR